MEFANAFVAASGRRVDWIHIPVLDRSDDAFFAPLKELEPQGARVYLGVIHNMAGFPARLQPRASIFPSSASAPIAASAGCRARSFRRCLRTIWRPWPSLGKDKH